MIVLCFPNAKTYIVSFLIKLVQVGESLSYLWKIQSASHNVSMEKVCTKKCLNAWHRSIIFQFNNKKAYHWKIIMKAARTSFLKENCKKLWGKYRLIRKLSRLLHIIKSQKQETLLCRNLKGQTCLKGTILNAKALPQITSNLNLRGSQRSNSNKRSQIIFKLKRILVRARMWMILIGNICKW